MHRNGEMNTAGDRWTPAPSEGGPLHTGSIMGVWVPRGMRVRWSYTYGPDGSYVSGYTLETVVPRPEKETDEKPDD